MSEGAEQELALASSAQPRDREDFTGSLVSRKMQGLCRGCQVPPVRGHLHLEDVPATLRTEMASGGSDGKESSCNAGDPGLISGLGRSPERGNGYPLQYCCLETSMDGGAWQATFPSLWGRNSVNGVHGVGHAWPPSSWPGGHSQTPSPSRGQTSSSYHPTGCHLEPTQTSLTNVHSQVSPCFCQLDPESLRVGVSGPH